MHVHPACGMTASSDATKSLDSKGIRHEQDHHELDDMTRRFVNAIVLAVPVLLLGMCDALPAPEIRQWLPPRTGGLLQGLLATPVVWGAGWPLLVRAGRSYLRLHLNMFSLIGLGTGAAWLFSAVALLFPALLPPAFKLQGAAPLYFKSAAVIMAWRWIR